MFTLKWQWHLSVEDFIISNITVTFYSQQNFELKPVNWVQSHKYQEKKFGISNKQISWSQTKSAGL